MNTDAKTKTAIHDFLSQEHIAVVSTVSEDATPYAATVIFSVDNELTLFFATRRGSQKHKNMDIHPTVSVVVSNPELMVTVQVHGTATEVTDPIEMQQFMEQMLKMSTRQPSIDRWMAPVHLLKNGDFVVMKVSPIWVSMGDFRDIQKNSNDYFQEIRFS